MISKSHGAGLHDQNSTLSMLNLMMESHDAVWSSVRSPRPQLAVHGHSDFEFETTAEKSKWLTMAERREASCYGSKSAVDVLNQPSLLKNIERMSPLLGKDSSICDGVVQQQQQQQQQSPQQSPENDDNNYDVDDNNHHHSQLQQEEEFKKFLHDDEDDDEFIVVSSRKKRLDMLLSEENNDDDDILIIRSSSSATTAGGKQQNQLKPLVEDGDRTPPAAAVSTATIVSTILILFVSSWYLFHLHSKRKKIHVKNRYRTSKEESASKRKFKQGDDESEEKDVINPPISKKNKQAVLSTNAAQQQQQQETAAILLDNNKDEDTTTSNVQNVPPSISSSANNDIIASIDTIDPDLRTETSNVLTEKEESSTLSRHDDIAPLHSELSSMETKCLTMMTKNTTTTTKTTTTTQLELVTTSALLPAQEHHQMQQARKNKLQIARGIAKDIKLVEDALKDEGVIHNSTEIAKDIVKDWHFSQRIIQNQNQIEFSKMQMETSQRILDRQLSQRQHEELLEATGSSASSQFYDPNWNEKLQSKRDRCWDIVFKLCREIGLIYVCSRRFVKPLQNLWMVSFVRHGDDDTNMKISINDVVWSVVSNVCDCGNNNSRHTKSTIAASFVVSDTTTAASTFDFMYSFIPHLSHTTTTYLFQYLGIGDSFSMTSIDVGMCYGNCLLTSCLVFSFIAVLHRALNIFAAPAIFHHFINGITLLFFSLFNNNKEETYPSSPLSSTATTSGMLTTLLFNNPQYVTLGFCFLGMFVVVQWNYKRSQTDVERILLLKNKSDRTTQKHLPGGESTLFQKSLQQSFNRMDALYWRLSIFRYIFMIGICSFCYHSFKNNYSPSSTSSSPIV